MKEHSSLREDIEVNVTSASKEKQPTRKDKRVKEKPKKKKKSLERVQIIDCAYRRVY